MIFFSVSHATGLGGVQADGYHLDSDNTVGAMELARRRGKMFYLESI
jgi:hypothetical protein